MQVLCFFTYTIRTGYNKQKMEEIILEALVILVAVIFIVVLIKGLKDIDFKKPSIQLSNRATVGTTPTKKTITRAEKIISQNEEWLKHKMKEHREAGNASYQKMGPALGIELIKKYSQHNKTDHTLNEEIYNKTILYVHKSIHEVKDDAPTPKKHHDIFQPSKLSLKEKIRKKLMDLP